PRYTTTAYTPSTPTRRSSDLVQNGMDKDNADFAREQLDAETDNINYEEVLDYLTMYNELTEGTVDAMIITDSSISLLEDQYSNIDRKSTRLNSSHVSSSYAVF